MRLGTSPGEAALPGATRASVAVAVLGLGLLVACGSGASATAQRPASADAAIARVHLRATTPPELRALLGDPDKESADGSLVYRFVGARRRESETETVRFQFDHGKLIKVCRTRS